MSANLETTRLGRFLDDEGRVKAWPAKRKNQKLVLAHLASAFAVGRDYSEREVNGILQGAHTYGDWVSLRRALVDDRLLDREADGSRYWRRPPTSDPAASPRG